MQKKSNSICFETEDGEEVCFSVMEETMLGGINYLLVTEDTEDDSVAYILQEMSEENDEKIYEIVDDEKKLEALSKVFAELVENVELKI